ncbi:MAG: hypothetical protein ACLFNI_11435 [Natronomonas sp.]
MVQEGQSFLWPGMSDNRRVRITDVGEGESGQLGSMAGEGEVKLSESVVIGNDRGRIHGVDELRAGLDPLAINRRRSDEARTADRAKDAELTTDPLTWASNPDEYDYPGVDTGPTFREVEGEDYDTERLLDSLF